MDLTDLEQFAFAENKAEVLARLIPGSEDHYQYHCLHHQHAGRFAEAATLLKEWHDRHGESTEWRRMTNRQTLLASKPKEQLAYLRERLEPDFHHQREAESRAAVHPSKLDQKFITRAALAKMAFARHSDLGGFTDHALDWLADEKLDGYQLSQLLSRLTRPDHPNLVALVLKAMASTSHPVRFGEATVHRHLLLDQLDQLAKKRPALLTEQAFVHLYVSKMRPDAESTWDEPGVERQKQLDRLWAFVEPLSPAFNSLKAHVLYHRLELDRALGTWERKRVTTYLNLPRHTSYMESDFLRRAEHRDHPAQLGQDFRAITGLASVRDDEPLVSEALSVLLRDASSPKEFSGLVQTHWLNRLFATTKILHGIGKQETWYDLLGDGIQALKERVDLEFAPTNRTTFRAADAVSLDLEVKNVPTLVVKVFEINTFAYYQATGREIDNALDLDGLVASDERTYTYDDAPLRRIRRTFTFAALNRAGVFVIEFIGGGRSSRALIRKGGLHLLERISAAGHVFAIADEDSGLLKDATLWLAGREFAPDASGALTVPFTAEPTSARVILKHGNRAALTTFQHLSESYRLDAGLFVEREHLLKRRQAQVLLRPALTLHGVAVDLSLLEDVKLSVTSTDHSGVASQREFPAPTLSAEEESVVTIQVPEGLATLSVALRARVRAVTSGKLVDLHHERTWQINGIDTTEQVDGLHLTRTADGHVLYLLGRSGEPRPGVHLKLTLKHREFTDLLEVLLQSDAQGRVELGALADIAEVRATNANGQESSWSLSGDVCAQPTVVHARAGQPIRIPYVGRQITVSRAVASLLTTTHGEFVADARDALTLKDGLLVAKGLPVGEHDLFLREDGTRIRLHISPAPTLATPAGSWAISARRLLELRERDPLHVQVEVAKADVVIRVSGATRHTRVHLVATRFLPAHRLFDALNLPLWRAPRLGDSSPTASAYLSGRDIGDEYRYILDRRQAKPLPGNLLTRPGLLLNPWAVRTTETGVENARGGGAYAGGHAKSRAAAGAPKMAPLMMASQEQGHANLDFLAQPAFVAANLRSDKDGVIRIPRADLAHTNHVRVVVLDRDQAVARDVVLPEAGTAHDDLRLKDGLDPLGHFTEQQQATPLIVGDQLTLPDITTAKIECVDSLPKLFSLYLTLSEQNATLASFSFITTWPTLSDEQKRAKYSEFACHELSFFLFRKDPAFFQAVIKPYLRNKRELTFLDRWLLGDDLATHLTPWGFGRLNAVERILLTARSPEVRSEVVRGVTDACDLLAPDPERDQTLFRTVLGGSALDDSDAFGLGEAREQAVSAKMDLADNLMASSGVGGAMMAEMSAPVACAPASMPAKAARSMMKKESRRSRDEEESVRSVAECDDEGGGGDDLARRAQVQQFFRKLDRTQEWAENHYWHLKWDEMGPDLIVPNAFWHDYAKHLAAHPSSDAPPFLSRHLALPTGSFSEMLFALAVLDLPFTAATPTVTYQGARMQLAAGAPQVAFHQEIKPATPSKEAGALLVTQHYLRHDDRSTWDGNEQHDKYVVGEFLTHVVYVCQVVVTNPTSARQRLDLLLQIPRGAIPVAGALATRGLRIDLDAYGTHRQEYAFYFPAIGTFPHFPVHVAKNGVLVAHGAAERLTVVREPSVIDRTSWAWISQHGDTDVVLAYLDKHNLLRLDLDQTAWRLRDATFHAAFIAALEKRRHYHDTTWSYALLHGDLAHLAQWLTHRDEFLQECGPWLTSQLVTTDPLAQGWYQHLEYAPLVNARAHRLGQNRTILNHAFAEQYRTFVEVACYRPTISHDDLLAATYYLLLQDRVDEGLALLARVDAKRISGALQHDYLRAYAAFFSDQPEAARAIAKRHQDHPVDRWRGRFRAVLAQLDEAAGDQAATVDPNDAGERQAQMAAGEAGIELKVEAGKLALSYRGLTRCTVNYYRMDIELLFSREPFVQSQAERFSFITPTSSDEVALPTGKNLHQVELPTAYRTANTVIEVVAGSKRVSRAHYAHALDVQVGEQYGQVRVGHLDSKGRSKPLPSVYVKAYARMQGGEVRFFKDGYTDLRGRFDYASLSTDELDRVERFALLIMSQEHGALIREASPPPR
jgi:hypothetical protein